MVGDAARQDELGAFLGMIDDYRVDLDDDEADGLGDDLFDDSDDSEGGAGAETGDKDRSAADIGRARHSESGSGSDSPDEKGRPLRGSRRNRRKSAS